jgi:hypothetical protein
MKQVPLSSYLLASTVFFASVFGLAMSVALPFFLAPAEYAHFSLMMAWSQLISSVGFEWIRVSVIRHAGSEDAKRPLLKRDLRTLYTLVVLMLLALAAGFALAALLLPILMPVALLCATAGVQGMFDGRSAWARANFDNITLSMAVVARPIFSLMIVVGIAWATRSGILAMSGLCLSYPLAALVFRDRPSDLFRPLALDLDTTRSLFRFGTTVAVGSNISLAVPATLRSIIVSIFGLSGAGGTLFALDISQRAFSTMGIALNTLHLQTLIRVIDSYPLAEAIRKARFSVALETVLYFAIVAMLIAAATSIGAVLSPVRYRVDFVAHLPMFALLMAILSLRQYAIDPLFIAFRRVRHIAVAPAVAIALFGLSYLLIWLDFADRERLFALLVGASAVSFFIPLLFMRYFLPKVAPLDIFVICAVATVAAAGLSAGPFFNSPIARLIADLMVSMLIYSVIVATAMQVLRLARQAIDHGARPVTGEPS